MCGMTHATARCVTDSISERSLVEHAAAAAAVNRCSRSFVDVSVDSCRVHAGTSYYYHSTAVRLLVIRHRSQRPNTSVPADPLNYLIFSPQCSSPPTHRVTSGYK